MTAQETAGTHPDLEGLSDRTTFVLVRPEFPGNVGSSARALKNMGLRRLAVVPGPTPRERLFDKEARALAHGAEDVLEGAGVFETLEDAIAESTFVVGTSARIRRLVPALPATRLAERILPVLTENRVAILFGPEDRGLTNRELDACQLLTHVPTSPTHRSLNLSQSVLLVAYELTRALRAFEAPGPGALARSEDAEGMFHSMEEVLLESGFLNPRSPKHAMTEIRQFFARAGLTQRESQLLRALWKQVLWALRRKPGDRLRWDKAREP